MHEIKCPITGEPASDLGPTHGDWVLIDCDAAGGSYEITRTAMEDARSYSYDPPRVVTWMVDQRRMGTLRPRVTSDLLEKAKSFAALGVAARVERLYRMLQSSVQSIGDGLLWQVSVYETDERHEEGASNKANLRAWTESRTDAEVDTLVAYGVAKGYVRADTHIALTIDGRSYLEAKDSAGASYDQAFVAMWFATEMAEIYERGIEPAIRDVGYVPMRIDRKEHNNKIDDEIVAEIRRSRFVVADFTCGSIVSSDGTKSPVPRGGVYYEAGFAQGLGIPVIWACRNDHIDLVHFDTRQFNHITWSTAAEFRQKLVNRIGAVIGDGPHRPARI